MTFEEEAEVAAAAIHDHWQNHSKGPAHRSWAETCEKFPPQAEDFRRKGRAVVAALNAKRADMEQSHRWRHIKRNSEYFELGRGELQVSDYDHADDGDVLLAYVSMKDGRMWFRRESEFEADRGRFERIKD